MHLEHALEKSVPATAPLLLSVMQCSPSPLLKSANVRDVCSNSSRVGANTTA